VSHHFRLLLAVTWLALLGAGEMNTIRQGTVLFCLQPTAAPLNIVSGQRADQVTDPELQALLDSWGGARIERWLPGATAADHRGAVYLNRIYRLQLTDPQRLSVTDLRQQLAQLPLILSTEPEYSRRP